FKQKTAYEIKLVTGVQTCALPISNVSLYALQHGAFAARVYRLVHDTDISLVMRHDRDGTQQGIAVARVFGDALELHGEAARRREIGRASCRERGERRWAGEAG